MLEDSIKNLISLLTSPCFIKASKNCSKYQELKKHVSVCLGGTGLLGQAHWALPDANYRDTWTQEDDHQGAKVTT